MPKLDPRPTLETPDDDPYLWLEEIESARALNWVEAQNAATLQRFNDAGVATDRKVLKAILYRPDNIPFPNELAHEVAAGVKFWGAELDAALVGVMRIQQALDVALIRHAYVAPEVQGRGLGGLLQRQ